MFYNWKQLWIADLIEEHSSVFEKLRFALITVIDSCYLGAEDATFNKRLLGEIFYEAREDGLLITGHDLVKIQIDKDIFTGFDEIWFFMNKPEMEAMVGSLVSPKDIRKEYSEKHEIWMSESKCILGLGDGCGLNYITTSKKISELIEEPTD